MKLKLRSYIADKSAVAKAFTPPSFILLLFMDSSVSLDSSSELERTRHPIGPTSLSSILEGNCTQI